MCRQRRQTKINIEGNSDQILNHRHIISDTFSNSNDDVRIFSRVSIDFDSFG